MKRLSKSRLFFLELVIDLIFFFLCAAICVTLFGRASQLSRHSRELNQALLLAESVAETFRGTQGDMALTAQQLDLLSRDGEFFARLDQNWQPAPEGRSPAYLLRVAPGEGDVTLSSISIQVCRYENAAFPSIFTLDASVYTGEVTR